MAMKKSTEEQREMDNAYKEFICLIDKSVEGAHNYHVITSKEYTYLKAHLKLIMENESI